MTFSIIIFPDLPIELDLIWKGFLYFFSGKGTFTTSHVQRIASFPRLDNRGFDIEFYVNYPGGGIMSQAVLLLIINQKLSSIAKNTGLKLTIQTIIIVPTSAPPTADNQNNSIQVVMKNFQIDEVRCFTYTSMIGFVWCCSTYLVHIFVFDSR